MSVLLDRILVFLRGRSRKHCHDAWDDGVTAEPCRINGSFGYKERAWFSCSKGTFTKTLSSSPRHDDWTSMLPSVPVTVCLMRHAESYITETWSMYPKA